MWATKVACLAILVSCCIGFVSSQSQLLPAAACLTIRGLFVTQGCVTNEDPVLCKILAFLLIFRVNNVPLCTSFPCAGYGQAPAHFCTAFLGCPFTDIELYGICSGVDMCCRNTTETMFGVSEMSSSDVIRMFASPDDSKV